jgi:transglutaminase-like putative cysteine protease
MRLKVEHRTTFSYDSPVYETATEIRLRPSDTPNAEQRLLNFGLLIEPTAPLFHYADYFGNRVYNFNLLQQHKGVAVTSTSVVETGSGKTLPNPSDEMRSLDLLHESRFVQFDDDIRDFASVNGASGSQRVLAEALCTKIRETFTYEPGVTDVHSPSSKVLAMRQGVCQDFAHVLIAACRTRGIPARYVSGYLYGGAQVERNDRASHAWCEVYLGPEFGWLGLDPTHDEFIVDDRYIRIGVGRDYADVPPVKGTYKGSSHEALKVVVWVTEA